MTGHEAAWWTRPLAETLDLPVVPTYGSRYEQPWPHERGPWPATQSWRCRTCSGTVTDRYAHELDHRKNSWVRELDKLYETVTILFGGR